MNIWVGRGDLWRTPQVLKISFTDLVSGTKVGFRQEKVKTGRLYSCEVCESARVLDS